MPYLRLLSPRQVLWAVGGLLLCLALVLMGLLTEGNGDTPEASSFTTHSSLKETGKRLGATGKAVARELGLPIEAPKGVPLADLGVTEERLQATVHHLMGHRDSGAKYWLFGAIVVWGWIYLVRIGRPDRASRKKRRKTWFPRFIYTITLVLSVTVAGFLLGKSPNPMEGAVKVFKTMVGLYPDALEKVLALLFFLGLAIVGNKIICGWGCPFGALQELLHSLPWLKKLKRRAKPPFLVMNLIRAALFLAVLLVLFGAIGGRKGLVLYHYLNPFNLFNLDFDMVSVVVTIVAALFLGLVIYRPFCQVICPFGFLSWIAERLSLYRVRIDHDLCDDCGLCDRACPSSAAKGLVKGDPLRADCFSCARCLNICPNDAIRYESVFRTRTSRAGAPEKRQAPAGETRSGASQ